ncbi:G8 domain-containing protein [Marinicella sediminis]|uniref:G8 domain-containing protein n=1 Tax=Marinicella sediminis TaxID=1792834 RepID=A0ABV7JHN1_9GAMM|nr:G8 domain-containing protein [Marinicella sediminis]
MKHHILTACLILSCFISTASDHHQLMVNNLFGDDGITHTASQSGSWFATSTWQEGSIPDANAQVLIPSGTTVVYDQVSAVSLQAVRVEGQLTFAVHQSSQMIVDTLLVQPSGRLVMGTENRPVAPGVTIDLLFRDTGDLDVTSDPSLMSRGLLASGPVIMHGLPKTPHSKVAVDPMAGDQQLTLATAPLNWQVGDTLVLAGTKYSGWKWDNSIQAVRYHGTQDEVVTIAAINGAVIGLNETLQYDHFTPRADLKTSVANMSRSITLATEFPDTTPTHRRGHVMFMQQAHVDVRYVSFWQLGRTDKSMPSLEAADFGTITPTSNVRGRYAFHLHRKGAFHDQAPVIAIGNAVFGSPGWGYVHHDSHAIFHNNVSFDTFGAGFVAETGNEIGAWTANLAIKAEGNSAFNPKNGNDRDAFDMGRTGDGFWFQGRLVRSVNNIAASVNHGFVYLHRGSGMLPFPGAEFMLPEALPRGVLTAPDDAPVMSFLGNESFASTVGLYVVKANPNQQHDVHSHFKDFTAWEVRAGSAMEYTAHYLLENFDVIGNTPEPFRNPAFGIEFGTNTSDMVINGAQIADMNVGVILSKNYTDPVPPETNQYVLIDVQFNNVSQHLEEYDPSIDQLLSQADLIPEQFNIDINGGIYEYLSPATGAGSGLPWVGQKTDQIGNSPIPAGTDDLGVPVFDMINTLEEDGYYRTAGGTPYAIVEEYFTERATGTIHKMGLKTLLGPDVDALLGNEFHAWRDAFQAGMIDLSSQSPVAMDDQYWVSTARPAVLNLIANDTDPESDPLSIDGIVQPEHGLVTDNLDGTVTYLTDFGFSGTDSFRYWATDDQGNYTPARVTINVVNDVIYRNDFAE